MTWPVSFKQFSLLFAYLAMLALSPAVQAVPSDVCYNPETTMPEQACVSGVHIIAVRGSNQSDTADNGEGKLYPIANAIMSNVGNSNAEGLQYPDSPAVYPCYMTSEEAGVTNLTRAVEGYANRCPNTKIVLLGASQGAQTIADTLCGSVLDPSEQTPLPEQYSGHIAAIAMFGELSRNHTAPWNRGNASTNSASGYYPRKNLAPCQPYANRMASYCQAGDYYCDSSYGVSKDEALYIHGMETTTYGDAATDFVVDTLRS